MPRHFGANRARGILGLAGDHFHRNHHIAFHLNHPAVGFPSDLPSPVFLVTQVSPVTDNQRCGRSQFQRDCRRPALLNHKFDPTLFQRPLGLTKSFQHEAVVPQIGFRVVIHQPKTDHHALTQLIGPMNGVLQRVVEFDPLGLLHPVENIASFAEVEVIQLLDAGFLDTCIRHRSTPKGSAVKTVVPCGIGFRVSGSKFEVRGLRFEV